MKFGQLMLGHTREDRVCRHCQEMIKAGDSYAALVYVKVGANKNKSFTNRVHRDCLLSYCDALQAQKAQYRREKRWDKVPRLGRPPTGATEEQLKERKKIQFYLFDCKNSLIKSYHNGDGERIRSSWLRYAKWLDAYGDEERVGRTNTYRFGPEIQQLVEDYLGPDGGQEFTAKLLVVEGDPKGLAAVLRGIYNYQEETGEKEPEDMAAGEQDSLTESDTELLDKEE